MNKKDLLVRFINTIKRKKILTEFIKFLFDYDFLSDYNYIFRIVDSDNKVIIDIYDNISDNRFNRYIFDYVRGRVNTETIKEGNVFVTYIDVFNIDNDNKNKMHMLAYLTTLDNDKMLEYAKTFLDNKYINILKDIIK